ncbi:beta-L-arabinofuranosidase domain-containing protein [Candidatus Poribacteria bacterium]
MGETIFEKPSSTHFVFAGPMGERVKANLDNWLLRAPVANPGMTEMFRLRDRQPKPELVPWAGEFVGKYLISAIQARRMTDSDELDALIRRVITDLIGCQADNGYLGPFTKEERLLGHWDLWGHYHWMLALMMWREDTGDTEALNCVIRAADLVCRTYLDTDKKVLDAGSHEMNMAIIHALGWLYRKTGTERYLQMMRQIEKEWEQAGDYFRAGLAGTEFFRTPNPRWESLHDVQGLVELYQITGDERYRTAFVNLWRSIAQYDRHNTGGFSTGEAAVGDPYAQGAIETCCTTAWMALTVDMLRLTGDPIAADELELSTWNSMLGSQHPSGRWWTYDTPMDGVRPASAHSIVFQARHGTPELNCCSVNAPRGLGMLSEWAVMVDDEGIIVNYYGQMEAALSLPDGLDVKLIQKTEYPVDSRINLTVLSQQEKHLNLRVRIPKWSKNTIVRVNGDAVDSVQSGSYLSIEREWRQNDVVEIDLDMSLRCEFGERACEGSVSICRGPLLLAYDQHLNVMDPDDVPPLNIAQLDATLAESEGQFQPIILLKAKSADGSFIRLCDFATAGAYGTHYRSWLPMK